MHGAMTDGVFDPWQWFDRAVKRRFAFLESEYGYRLSGIESLGRLMIATYTGERANVVITYEPLEGWLDASVAANGSDQQPQSLDDLLIASGRSAQRVFGREVSKVETEDDLDDLVSRQAGALRQFSHLLRFGRMEP